LLNTGQRYIIIDKSQKPFLYKIYPQNKAISTKSFIKKDNFAKIVFIKINMKRLILFAILCVAIIVMIGCAKNTTYTVIDGLTMGTTYHIIHDHADTEKIKTGIDTVLAHIDNSLSVYNPNSIISKINNNENVIVDSFFIEVFQRSREISSITNGAFDISASPLFNAWGFGFKNKESLTEEKIDSLKQFIGMENIWLEGNQIAKSDSRVTINANAVAKGFGVDAVARFLEHSGVENYIVEIGGEIRCKGKNSRGALWSVGIDKPIDGNMIAGENMQAIIRLSDKSLATSGNYRKYYEEEGKKYAHTINPVSGYPVSHNLLSATVLASDCMSADAFATAFMVMGLEKSKEFLAIHSDLGALLIYDNNGQLATFATDNIKKLLHEK